MAEPDLIKKPKRLRRICWCSLAVVVLCVVGLYAYGSWRSEKQRAAIARLGGRVRILGSKPTSNWLRRIGIEDSVELLYVDFTNAKVSNDDLKHLTAISNVYFLGLSDSQITDDGLRYVSHLDDLEILFLANTSVTNDGLKHLRGLTLLTNLNLSGTQVTDLRNLIGMKNLGVLSLEDSQVTDEGLRHLKGKTSLDYLYLSGTQITDDALIYLRSLPNLRRVDLLGTRITYSGKMHLQFALPKCQVN